jgi:homopolymeric O-antigen transport system permease protein
MHAFPLSLAAFGRSLVRNRELVVQMAERDTKSRYRGSAMGIFWAGVNPLLMLAVYTFFFGEVFQAKWASAPSGRADFALILYIGLLLHGFVAETLTRAPTLVASQPNFVKKVVFPLELLPVVGLVSAMFHFVVGLGIWFAFHIVLRGMPPVTALLLPLAVLPLAVMMLGLSFMLASLGVYLRDVNHVITFVASVLLFASPIFYPLSAVREPFRSFVELSPLTLPVEQARVFVFGGTPDFLGLGLYSVVALAIVATGFAWFQGTRKGFADVI